MKPLRLFVLVPVLSGAIAASPHNVLDHRAVPDGKTLNTAALNRLVAETSAAGFFDEGDGTGDGHKVRSNGRLPTT